MMYVFCSSLIITLQGHRHQVYSSLKEGMQVISQAIQMSSNSVLIDIKIHSRASLVWSFHSLYMFFPHDIILVNVNGMAF